MKTTTHKTLQAIEALPLGTHKIAPRLYLTHEIKRGRSGRRVQIRWMTDGQQRKKSLGKWQRERWGFYLAEVERVAEARQQGRDVGVVLDEGTAPDTFKAAAQAYMDQNLGAMRNPKSRKQWRASVEALYPVLGDLKITQLEIGHIAKALAPDWLRIPVKVHYVRRRIELILSFAISRGNLAIGNVAALDLLRHRLPKQPRRHAVPRRALPLRQVSVCFAKLGEQWLSGHEALRFAMLTAMRSSEVRLMKWSELDFDQAVWTCPAERLKMGKAHRVPLSRSALALLARLQEIRRGPYVFAGRKPDKALSLNVLRNALERVGFLEIGTPHGMRSSFKDWARETGIQQEFGWEAVEMCLAHDVQGDVERHYGRSDLLHLRKPIMEKWGAFVAGHRKVFVTRKAA